MVGVDTMRYRIINNVVGILLIFQVLINRDLFSAGLMVGTGACLIFMNELLIPLMIRIEKGDKNG